MKILHLNTYDDPADGSGAERIMLALAKGFRDRGIENVIVGTKADGAQEKFERDGIFVWQVPLSNLYWPHRTKKPPFVARRVWHMLDSYNWTMRRRLTKIVIQERPDVCIVNGLPGWSVGALTALSRQKIPAVQILHDFYYICPNTTMSQSGINCNGQCRDCNVLRLFHRRLSNSITAVIGVSRFVLSRHIQYGYFKNVPFKEVIPNAVTIATPKLKKATNPPSSFKRALRFGFIGTLSPHKGIAFLLSAFCNSVADTAELVIAGEGETEYVTMLHEQWSLPTISFVGKVSPDDFFRNIDVCVVPSLWNENFPGVICESLVYGVRVIGSRRGGIPEMIIEGQNGFLFDPDTPNDLENILIKLVRSSSNLYEEIYSPECEKFSPCLDPIVWISRYMDLFRRMGLN
jgi:glycosyltransferase involved in cell wall biosynthesis